MKNFSIKELYKSLLGDSNTRLQREWGFNSLSQEIFLDRNGIRYNFYFRENSYFLKRSTYEFVINCENIKAGKSFKFNYTITKNELAEYIALWEEEYKSRNDKEYQERKDIFSKEFETKVLDVYNL